MRTIFFDLDGTLCESKQPVQPEMIFELERLNLKYKVIIISGAELSRMLIQCPIKYMTYMSQNGNEVYDNEKLLWQNKLENKEKIQEHINTLALEMSIEIGDDMVDDRGAQISFSFVGHHAPLEEKKVFDPTREKREELLEKHPFNGAVIGGTTCIDYIPYTKGDNIKRYITMRKMRPWECLYLGDALTCHGNDTTVLGVVPVFQVKSPQDTLNFLKQIW